MPDNPYPKWRQDRCECCRKGQSMSSYKRHHWTGNPNPPECTAPTEEEYIAELEARIESLTHSSNPRTS